MDRWNGARGPRAVTQLLSDMGPADTRLPIADPELAEAYDFVTVGPTHEGMWLSGAWADERPRVVRAIRVYPFAWIGDEAVRHEAGEWVTFWWTVPVVAPIEWERADG